MKCKRLCYLSVLIFCCSLDSTGQVPGLEGINDASSDVESLFNPVADLIMVIGSIVGVVGGGRVFIKWNSGDRHIERDIIGWFGSCIFLVLVSVMMKSMFL